MRRIATTLLLISLVLALGAAPALAQKGHFAGRQSCIDSGTWVECRGKVVGLRSTTFTINVTAQGTATVECTNPGGEVAAGQSFSSTFTGTTGPLSTPPKGRTTFTVSSEGQRAPAGSCPNEMWTAVVTDVAFTTATLTLFEDTTVSDTITVPVS